MKIKTLFAIFITVVFLVGCSANLAPSLLQGTQTSQTEALLPTPTSSLPGIGISPTPLANKFHIHTHYPDEKLGLQDLPNLPGTLVLSADNQLSSNNILSPEPGKNSMLSFWNPQSNSISTYNLTEGEEYYYFAESPDKEKLAFTEGKTATISFDLIVLNNQAEKFGRIVVPDDWTFFHWFDNNQLILQQFIAKEKFDQVAINLSDKNQQTLFTNFPDLYLNELFWSWGSQILLNSDATLVLYPVRQHNPEQIYSVLWNVKENKEVVRIAGSGWARWSPDGSRFLLITDVQDKVFERQNDILLINSSGEPTRATFFTEYYEKVWIEQPVWSPDNRYIAFWLITTGSPFETAQLGVLDTETLTVDLLCKEINPRPFRFGDSMGIALGFAEARVNSAIPIWSPDSYYLLIEDNNGIDSSTYLYDFQNYTVTKIADQARPVGWLK